MTRIAIGAAALLGLIALDACVTPLAAQPATADLSTFQASHGSAWRLDRDPATSRPRRLTGGAFSIATTPGATEASQLAGARALLAEAAPLLELDALALQLREPGLVTSDDGFAALHFDIAPRGVPIEGADVAVAISHGSVIAVHVVGQWGATPSILEATPRIVAVQARAAALTAAKLNALDVLDIGPRLAFLPRDGALRLAWKITLIDNGPRHDSAEGARLVAWIDAHDASLISLTDETLMQCAPPTAGGAPRRVVAGVRTNAATDIERSETLSSVTVGASLSDSAGLFAPPPAPSSASLAGPVARIECVDCAFPESPLAAMDPNGNVDFGIGGIDGGGNGLATPADRTAYFHVERVHRQAVRWLTLPWLAAPITVRTNLPNTCNAYWNGIALNFFRSSAACSNTGEIRDVVSHEWGHGLDENDGIAPPGVSTDAATGEAAADIVALLRSRDACVGESFFLDPADWPSTACSGVRDLDEHAPGQRRGVLTSSTVAAQCPPSAFYRGVAGREGHCEGEILGQTFWHLVRTLSTGSSYGDGRVLGIGLGDELAWQVAEALFYRSRPLLASYAPSDAQSIGMSAHEAFLLADDEGDGLASGTPHAWAINEAFAHHGIEETPAPAPSSVACSLATPVVTATAMLDATSGLPFVRVAWSDVGAASYQVLRDDADGGGLQPFAAAFGTGAGSADDRGVLPARTPRYVVVAEAANGCQSAAAATAAAMPALRVASLRIDDSVTGNNDARLSANETADLIIELANDGGEAATNVSATLTDVDAAVTILAGGPLAYGRIAAATSVMGPGAFRIRSAPTAPSFVTLEIAAEATEGCLRATYLLPIARPELRLASTLIDDATGDADGAWDPGENIGLAVNLLNDGQEDAPNVTGTLTFRGPPPPGVTITRSGASWGDIAVAATVASNPPGLALSATLAVPRGTVVRLDLALEIDGVAHRTLPIDILIGGVAQGLVDWQVDMGAIPGFGTGEIVNQEIAIQTNDDDGDGVITGCDVPDVIVETWNVGGTDKIAVLSGDDGRVLHAFPVTPCRPGWDIFQSLAAADIDGDGETEILTDDSGRTCAFELDGTLLWKTPVRVWTPEFTPGHCAAAPQVWDFDGDGRAEIVVGRTVLDGPTGTVIYADTTRRDTGRALVGDIDLDGAIDIISYRGEVRHGDGSLVGTLFPGFWQHGGIVNLDADPEAELVYMAMVDQPTPSLVARDTDGRLMWEWPGEAGHDLRPAPCFGDFDGDGFAETALPTASEMIMFEEDGTEGWRLTTADGSGAAGCSVFDFDADGRPEIVYRDERSLQVIQGSSGVVLWSVACRAPTHYECPIILDVDRDGSAEIVIHETAGGNRSTLRAYGNPAWPAARGIWNQEAYAVTHVSEAGVAEVAPAQRWLTGNDYRGQAIACPCSGAELSVNVDLPCDTSVACLSATINGGVEPFTLAWDFGDGSATSYDVAPCHDYVSAGTYVGRVMLTDAQACRADASFVVVIAEPLVVTVTGEPVCPGETCFHATVAGGTAPFELTWAFDGAATALMGVDACNTFAGATWDWRVFVRDARGCLAEAGEGGALGAPPENVGAALRVRDHGDPHAAVTDATLDWTLDFGAPRPVDDTFLLLRDTTPTGLTQILGTAGHLPTTWFDSTPAGTLLPHVHYYVILAESACGAISSD